MSLEPRLWAAAEGQGLALPRDLQDVYTRASPHTQQALKSRFTEALEIVLATSLPTLKPLPHDPADGSACASTSAVTQLPAYHMHKHLTPGTGSILATLL